jgi:membrane-bound metal-dependent hydrolase YbcI (DUF457 family)
MPNYKGHLVGGSIAYAITFLLLRGWQPTVFRAIEWFAFTLIGALFPDIDTKSKGQNLFYKAAGILFIFLIIQQKFKELAFISFVSLFPLIIQHRGITHSLWFIIMLCSSVILFVHLQFPHYSTAIVFDVLFFFVGAVSHLVLDRGVKRTFFRF